MRAKSKCNSMAPLPWLAAAVAVALVVTVAIARAGGRPVQHSSGRAAVETALRQRLDRAYLSFRWVFCVTMDRLYAGRPLWRCNVDFGDPHIVQYCVILAGHTLVTDRENHRLDCAPRATSKRAGAGGAS